MSKIFQDRIADRILKIMSNLFLREISDPRLQALTVTKVVVDREVSHANVYVASFEDEANQHEIVQALAKANGFLRRQLSRRLHTRTIPQLHFHWDPTLSYAMEVDELLDNLEIPPEEPNDDSTPVQ